MFFLSDFGSSGRNSMAFSTNKGKFMNATIKTMFCAAAFAAAGPAWPQGEGVIQGFYKNIPMQSRGATIATLGLPAGKFIVTVTAEAVAYLNATASVNAFTPVCAQKRVRRAALPSALVSVYRNSTAHTMPAGTAYTT